MAITASMVKELRELTGAGMMECKKALTATDGDIDKAVEHLREKGLAAAEKKAGRIAAEGLVDVNISEDGKVASIVEVNSETDFVAKMINSKNMLLLFLQVAKTDASNVDEFLDEKWELDTTKTVRKSYHP